MTRTLSVSTAILLLLLPAIALAAPAHKRHVYHAYGDALLPGLHQLRDNNIPDFALRGPVRHTRDYTPSYWFYGGRYYFGEPGFFRGRYNGGSFGPCWTRTPIGPIWNCG